jgi:hypothetical protein
MSRTGTSSNPDCTFSAKGYGTFTCPVVGIDFGPTIIATEDMGRDNRIFYPMQVQMDTFSVSAIFATKEGSNAFNRFIWRYAEFASTPGSSIAVGLRVRMPARRFDFMGFPVSGWSYHWAPVQLTDVTWIVTINFDGAAPVGGQAWVGAGGGSQFANATGSPSADPNLAAFYPPYYQGVNAGGGGLPNNQYNSPVGVPNPSS